MPPFYPSSYLSMGDLLCYVGDPAVIQSWWKGHTKQGLQHLACSVLAVCSIYRARGSQKQGNVLRHVERGETAVDLFCSSCSMDLRSCVTDIPVCGERVLDIFCSEDSLQLKSCGTPSWQWNLATGRHDLLIFLYWLFRRFQSPVVVED